ncbi:unnamed protein product [Lampetra fluviatilis]
MSDSPLPLEGGPAASPSPPRSPRTPSGGASPLSGGSAASSSFYRARFEELCSAFAAAAEATAGAAAAAGGAAGGAGGGGERSGPTPRLSAERAVSSCSSSPGPLRLPADTAASGSGLWPPSGRGRRLRDARSSSSSSTAATATITTKSLHRERAGTSASSSCSVVSISYVERSRAVVTPLGGPRSSAVSSPDSAAVSVVSLGSPPPPASPEGRGGPWGVRGEERLASFTARVSRLPRPASLRAGSGAEQEEGEEGATRGGVRRPDSGALGSSPARSDSATQTERFSPPPHSDPSPRASRLAQARHDFFFGSSQPETHASPPGRHGDVAMATARVMDGGGARANRSNNSRNSGGSSSSSGSGSSSDDDDDGGNHRALAAAAGSRIPSNGVGNPARNPDKIKPSKTFPAATAASGAQRKARSEVTRARMGRSGGDDEDEDDDDDDDDSFVEQALFNGGGPGLSNYDCVEGGGIIAAPNSPTGPPMGGGGGGGGGGFGPPGYPHATPKTPFHNAAMSSYPPQYPQTAFGPNQLSSSMGGLSVQPESLRPVNLLQERNLLPPTPVEPPKPNLHPDMQQRNCHPDIFRCTLTNIPQTPSLLGKAKLPLGLLLHPFKDLQQLPVITASTIVRCRACRTYINPFVTFIDQRRWKCNLCFRVNEVPDDFMYNPLTRSYGEPQKRPEIRNATIEFIAPSEYMVRPPQPAVYIFLLDVSFHAVECGYLPVVCNSILEHLDRLPGDSRTKVGIVTFDSAIHFYSLQEGQARPQMVVVTDIDDVFIPSPEGLLVNLQESKELFRELLQSLPTVFPSGAERETQSALGPALQAAHRLLGATGGRVTVFQSQLPSVGPGALKPREVGAKGTEGLSPATDFYKKLALDCSAQQTAVDLFLLSSQYADLATLSCISRFSSGAVYYYPSPHPVHAPAQLERLRSDLQRYLTRKIGFEAVMRIRCTKGLSIHTFHGNFFVRSTDLLSLPNVNPDAGFAVQVSIEEALGDAATVSFQAALLYTSSKGERRIRVHTLCLPVVTTLIDIYAGADVQAVTALLAKMAVDRTLSSSLSDARDALVNAAVDFLAAYRGSGGGPAQSGLTAPHGLRLLPLYALALLKQKAFGSGKSVRLDERAFAMCEMKHQPLGQLMRAVHPSLYRVDNLTEKGGVMEGDVLVPQPPLLQLSAERLSGDGAFLLDSGTVLQLWVGRGVGLAFLHEVLGVQNVAAIQTNTQWSLPELPNAASERVRSFVSWLRRHRAFPPPLQIIRDDGASRSAFVQSLVEDRTESAMSYYELLLHVQQQVCK